MSDAIVFERHGGIARLRFNRPEVKNALSLDMCRKVRDIVQLLREDVTCRVLLIEAIGTDFCSGADMGDLARMTNGTPAQRAELVGQSALEFSHGIFLGLASLDIPIVCAVRGYAVGAGFQFALSADLVVASETTQFLAPMANLAHSSDHGESYLLPRKVGELRASQILLLGERFGAHEAEQWGIVNWVEPDGHLETKAEEVVTRLAQGAPFALRGIKSLLRQSRVSSMEQQFENELEMVARCAATDDFVEAIKAYSERRKPVYAK
ncbi:enoyl-CoA hydratase/isomerase family protein [Pseudomonas fluorescens]|uniref:Carnitinyl-CoA dehydratase n=1 Tax=Pseudomonas fluorescens TaxID=294 RepID=A0A5E7BZ45_PSEFL|nr:enoyl-CoA hydratase-related protein [Pseudomonas fluorescens]VVN97436.1 Carnitinyl-CoA dehydratase [Pseudomonas fluorescens]